MSSSIPEGDKIHQKGIADGQRLPDDSTFRRTFIGGKSNIQNSQGQTVLGDAGLGDGTRAHLGPIAAGEVPVGGVGGEVEAEGLGGGSKEASSRSNWLGGRGPPSLFGPAVRSFRPPSSSFSPPRLSRTASGPVRAVEVCVFFFWCPLFFQYKWSINRCLKFFF